MSGPIFQARSPPLPDIRSRANVKMPSLVTNMNEVGPQRVREIELRLNQVEQSNRALLEELMRLQNDHKMSIRRYEQSLDEERQQRRQAEQLFQALSTKTNDMEDRLRRADQGLGETKGALAQLVAHTRNVEKAVTNSQQDLINRKDQSTLRVQELKQEVVHFAQTKEQLERVLYSMRDEVHELKTRLEASVLEINGLKSSVSIQSRMVEEQVKRGLTGPTHDPVKQQLENRVLELHHAFMEMRGTIEREVKTREMNDQSVSNRVSDIMGMITEQNRKREEGFRALDHRQREWNASSENERQKLQNRLEHMIGTIEQEVNMRHKRLMEDLGDKVLNLEKQLAIEKQNRLEDRKIGDELERKIHSTRKTLDDDITAIHGKMEHDAKNLDAKIRELNKGTNLLDQQIIENRSQVDKVIAAEIKARKASEKDIHKRIDDCEDKLRTGMASLTDAMTALKNNPKDKNTDVKIDMLKMHEISQDKADDVKKTLNKDIQALQDKLNRMDDKLAKQEKDSDLRLKELSKKDSSPAVVPDNELRTKVDNLSFSHERLKRQVDEMQNDVRRMPREITELDTRIAKLEKNNTDGASKAQMDKMQKQLDQTQTSVRKLAESVQVVKNVLTDKINDETSTREQQTTALRSDVKRIKTEINRMYEE